MSRLTTSELQRFYAGEEALFRRLVDDHSPHLLALVRSFAVDLDEAHDLVQETWQRAYAKRMSYSGSGPLLGWLYAVCRNVCLASVRKQAARRRTELDGVASSDFAAAYPDETAERAELRRSIKRALMELPDRERDVVVLRMLEQKSTRETAEALGCAEGTVKAALHHALKKLQVAMEVWVR
ncbi:MAG: RNA polymerase sigma factor [Gemmatimonadota bacterium]